MRKLIITILFMNVSVVTFAQKIPTNIIKKATAASEYIATELNFDENQKLSCISSAMHLIKLLTAEAQSNSQIFHLIEKFFIILTLDNWIQKYIFWELELLKLLGYDLELKNMVEKAVLNEKVSYFVKSSSEKKIIPNFLIDENHKDVDLKNLLKGLKLVTDYLEKSILKPNNINLPSSRTHFVNLLK